MRLEATVPDSRGSAGVQLANELGLSRSQIIDEALALYLKVVLEVRRGRRLVTLDPGSASPACEIATPTLTALEWALDGHRLEMSTAELAKIQAVQNAAPTPGARLKAAAQRVSE